MTIEHNEPVVCWKGRKHSIHLGQTFGRLTVLARAPNIGSRARFLVKCSCGESPAYLVRGDSFLSGGSKSCGCLQREKAAEGARAKTKRPADWPPIHPDKHFCPTHDGGKGADLPKTEFGRSARTSHGLHGLCKACKRDSDLKYLYGPDWGYGKYDAVYEEQRGRCLVCGEEKGRAGVGLKGSEVLLVEHCHETSDVRGLVCMNCNHSIKLVDRDVPAFMYLLAYRDHPPAEGMVFTGENIDVDPSIGIKESKHSTLRRCHKDAHGNPLGLADWFSLVELQGGCCAGCGDELDLVSHNATCTDHHHVNKDGSGPVRGLLCHGCNASFGNVQEDEDLIDRCVAYVLQGRLHEGKTPEELGIHLTPDQLVKELAKFDFSKPPAKSMRAEKYTTSRKAQAHRKSQRKAA